MTLPECRLVIALCGVIVCLTACGGSPVDHVPLPGRPGVGPGSYSIVVEMADVTNLVRNAEVKVDDLTVGTVTNIAVKDWHAELTVGLRQDVQLPANAVAKIGQKSLLGAEYLELASPTSEPPHGQLNPGEVIPLSRTDRYPDTEEVLASLSVVLNGGGLEKVRTITTELNAALGGREDQIRQLLENLNRFSTSLNDQRGAIVKAIDSIDGLSSRLNAHRDSLAESIDALPAGLKVLNDQRAQLVNALSALSDLGDISKRVVDRSGKDLLANLHDLEPVLGRLADSADNIAGALLVLPTFPWAHLAYPGAMRGDYINIHMTLDLSPKILAQNFSYGFSIPKVPFLDGLPPLGPGQGGGDPLLLPLGKAPAAPVPPIDLSGLPLGGAFDGPDLGRRGPQQPSTPDRSEPSKPTSRPSPSGLPGGTLGAGQ
jgi:phospholipid/cholesterol/gamma-HCH transport system substrate-binding protein